MPPSAAQAWAAPLAGEGRIIYSRQRTDYYYFHYNHKGDVVSVTDANKTEVAYYEYDAWGNTMTEAGSWSSPYSFSTKERDRDGDSGLTYFGARYYSPEIGRWTQRDPAGRVDGLNVYIYVANSPAVFLDAWGDQLTWQPPPRGPDVTVTCTSTGGIYREKLWMTNYEPGCPGTITGAQLFDVIAGYERVFQIRFLAALGPLDPDSLYQTGLWFEVSQMFYDMIHDDSCKDTCKRWTLKVREGAVMTDVGTYELGPKNKAINVSPTRRIEVYTPFLGPVEGPCVTKLDLDWWKRNCVWLGIQTQ